MSLVAKDWTTGKIYTYVTLAYLIIFAFLAGIVLTITNFI